MEEGRKVVNYINTLIFSYNITSSWINLYKELNKMS